MLKLFLSALVLQSCGVVYDMTPIGRQLNDINRNLGGTKDDVPTPLNHQEKVSQSSAPPLEPVALELSYGRYPGVDGIAAAIDAPVGAGAWMRFLENYALAAALRSFDSQKLTKIAGTDSMAIEAVKLLDGASVDDLGNQRYLIHLNFKSQKNMSFFADKDWATSCRSFERVFGLELSLKIKGTNKDTNKDIQVPSPFDGKTCTQDVLKRYRFYNFQATESEKFPSMSVLIRKHGSEVWTLFSKKTDSLAEQLRSVFNQF